MCLRCAGWNDDQIARRYARLIDDHGWAAVAVDADVPWTYTMGLRWRHDHPELIVVGMDPVEAHHVLRELVERIEEGEVARACGAGTTSLRALQVRLDQLDGCDVCFDRQRALERPCSASVLAAVRHPEPAS